MTPAASQSLPKADSRAWVVVGLLFTTACLNYADRTALSAVFPLLQRDLGLSDLALAALGSFFLWSYALASPFAGWLADRRSRSRVITVSLAAWSLVTIWTGMARSANELLLTRIVLGLTEAAYLPAAVALIADHHPPASRATALGIHLCGLNLGLVLGGGLAGYFGEQYGWQSSLLVIGGLGLVLAVVEWSFLKDGPLGSGQIQPAKSRLRPQLARLLRTPSYVLIVLQAMLISIGIWMFFNWMPLYFKENFDLSLAAAGLSGTAALQLSASAGMIVGGYTSDVFARRGLSRRMLLMTLAYLVAAPCLLVFTGNFSFLIVTAAIVIFSLGRAVGSSNEGAIICDLLSPFDRSTALALMNTMNCLAGGLGILLAGYVRRDWSLATAFSSMSVLVLLAAGLSFITYRVYLPRDLACHRESKS